MTHPPLPSLDIARLHHAYRSGALSPTELVEAIWARIATQLQHNVWIHLLSKEELAPYLATLVDHSPDDLPLFGVPFAIKDNIDLAGIPTTAACPDYAYTPSEHAPVVQALLQAGAIPLGKTNLDQFATGLVGTRSPYGPARNAFDPKRIAGGSSSGSALAVTLGQVSFSLGTDTAGSGRVPAAFGNLIGHKPSHGLLSTRGVVPACRSLDCVSIFGLCAADVQRVLKVTAGYDAKDPYARPAPRSAYAFSPQHFCFGVPAPEQLAFFGNAEGFTLFQAAVAQLTDLGGQAVEIDFTPFLEAARLLYEGPWVSERTVAIEAFLTRQPESLHPVTRQIILGGRKPSAIDAFKAQYRLQALRRSCASVWQSVEVVLTPTAPRLYTLDEIDAETVQYNTNLGYYTNFMNLLDLSATAVPAGFDSQGLPFGVTVFAPAGADEALLALADRLQRACVTTLGASQTPLPELSSWPLPAGWTKLAVCGAHLSGLPLNHQLTERGGYLLESTRTAPYYRLFALPGGPPHRPGLIRDTTGNAIEIEIWALPLDQFGSFVAGIPAPLGIGTLETLSGEQVQGFLCEAHALGSAKDITALGSWRQYLLHTDV